MMARPGYTKALITARNRDGLRSSAQHSLDMPNAGSTPSRTPSNRWPVPYANPVPVTRDGVVRLLRAAWAGEPRSNLTWRYKKD